MSLSAMWVFGAKRSKLERTRARALKIRKAAAKKFKCSKKEFPWSACLEIAAHGKLKEWMEIVQIDYDIQDMTKVSNNIDDLIHIFKGKYSGIEVMCAIKKMISWGVIYSVGRYINFIEDL